MKKLLSIVFLFSFAAAFTANAQVVYNSRTTFDLAHPGNFVIDFNNLTPAPFQYPDVTISTPVGNVGFDAIPSGNNIEFLDSNIIGLPGSGNLVLYALNGQFLTDSLLITLPGNTFSFGTDILSPSQTVPEPYQFTIYSGSTVLATLASPSLYGTYTFFGYDSGSSPITSVAVQIANGIGNPEPVIDNFTVAVPEPSTWAMLLAGAGLLGFQVLRRRRSA